MRKFTKIITTSTLLAATLMMSGCATFNKMGNSIGSLGRTLTGVGNDNTPPPSALVAFNPQDNPHLVWSNNPNGGVDKDYLRLGPYYADGRIFTAGAKGLVVATDPSCGRTLWHTSTGLAITSGPAIGDGIVVVIGAKGNMVALNEYTGAVVWRSVVPNAVLATPAIGQGKVVVKTVDGQLCAFSTVNGQTLWLYNHGAPILVMRHSGTPIIVGNEVVTGFSDGKLSAFDLDSGRLMWEQTIATPQGDTDIQQVVDIVADPVYSAGVIYVATYQGNIAAVNAANGNIIWQQAISSYTGLTLGPNLVYITDAQGVVWAFNRMTGNVVWQQNALLNRALTAPEVMDNTIIVADGYGYLHWLSQANGIFVARSFTGSHTYKYISTPLVLGNYAYVMSTAGQLSAWAL